MLKRRANSRVTGALFAAVLLVPSIPSAAASGEADNDMLEAGRQVFMSEAVPPCAVCHTLADAEATGAVGPDLDRLQPTLEQVRAAVTGGVGIMPAYGDLLSEAQIEAVAHYVADVAGADS